MPGYLLQQGATVLCVHGGQAQATVPNPRVKAGGQATTQQPNPWTVIAALTKALQEAQARIEALEAKA